jgi:ABC-2 type transport system permease protein
VIGAILRAQLLSMRLGASRGTVFTVVSAVIWYGLWCFISAAVYIAAAHTDRTELGTALPLVFLAILAYWQLVPAFSASMGAGLDMRKLRIYPVPHASLFRVELLLRLTSGVEMVMVLTAGTVGLLRNGTSLWIVAFVLVFMALNVFLASGLRSLLERLLTRRKVREFVGLFFLVLYVLPRVLMYSGTKFTAPSIHAPPALAFLGLGAATLAAFWFGRTQFERNLVYDAVAEQAGPVGEVPARRERLYRLPSLVLRDPLAAVVEKELRSLARTPRFRMVFLMGFTFGIAVWFPVFMGRRNPQYLLIITSIYALTLLGQVSYWNCFGLDRAAAAFYFAAPAPLRQAIIGKNIAALVYVYLEVLILAGVTSALRLASGRVLETLVVVGVCALYLLAIGNLSSVHYPRSLAAERVSQSSGSGFQGLLFLMYPVVLIPVGMAYVARWALQSQLAFVLVLAIAAMIGAVIYGIALESATHTAHRRREQILQALSAGQGPVA